VPVCARGRERHAGTAFQFLLLLPDESTAVDQLSAALFADLLRAHTALHELVGAGAS
jgi:hypothetical protein